MARSRFIYTLKEVASMIGENLELIEEVTANSDNIAEGELVYVRDGSEDGTKGLTENGVNDLRDLLADIGTWDGGIRQFLLDERCDPEMIERVMADEAKRSLLIRSLYPAKIHSPDAHEANGSITVARGFLGPLAGASRHRSMYLRTVLRSMPVCLEIADTVIPC